MRMKRRLTAILLCLCMALTLLPATVFAANEPVDYNLVVAGVTVTNENADDILDDGTVSYDPVTKVLTLHNAVLDGGIVSPLLQTAAI